MGTALVALAMHQTPVQLETVRYESFSSQFGGAMNDRIFQDRPNMLGKLTDDERSLVLTLVSKRQATRERFTEDLQRLQLGLSDGTRLALDRYGILRVQRRGFVAQIYELSAPTYVRLDDLLYRARMRK